MSPQAQANSPWINAYSDEKLSKFCLFHNNQKVGEEEIIEHLELSSLIQKMIMHDFDPAEHTTTEFVEFCERLEFAEGVSKAAPKFNGQKTTFQKGVESKGSLLNAYNKQPRDEGITKYTCLLHGPNNTHSTDQCRVLQSQAEKMSAGLFS